MVTNSLRATIGRFNMRECTPTSAPMQFTAPTTMLTVAESTHARSPFTQSQMNPTQWHPPIVSPVATLLRWPGRSSAPLRNPVSLSPATTSCGGVRRHLAHPCTRPARRARRASLTNLTDAMRPLLHRCSKLCNEHCAPKPSSIGMLRCNPSCCCAYTSFARVSGHETRTWSRSQRRTTAAPTTNRTTHHFGALAGPIFACLS